MPSRPLEEAIESLTREFVGRLVDAIRNASFAEVASLSSAPARARSEPRAAAPKARPAREARPHKTRQTADRRAEMGDRVLRALGQAGAPMGVRALASDLGVPTDVLAAPLRELRAAGRIRKHGEKRATTYSVA